MTAAAISCWSSFVVLVLSDANFRLPDPGQESLTPIKDAKWLEEASKQASVKLPGGHVIMCVQCRCVVTWPLSSAPPLTLTPVSGELCWGWPVVC